MTITTQPRPWLQRVEESGDGGGTDTDALQGTPVDDTPTSNADQPATDDVAKWKAMARKHEKEAKANAKAAKELQALRDAQKSAEEKQAERIQQLEAELSKRDADLLRNKIGAEMGLPASLIGRIKGADEDEMRDDAQTLLDDLGKRYVPKSKPTPEQSGAGVNGQSESIDSLTPDQLAERFASKRR